MVASMALLAEPKRKTKFGLDPRNTNWSNDDSRFGQRLMEKMGWEKGKGLGANSDGMTENIKATYKSDSRGLGCSLKEADAWIAHQDDFNELLKNLNAQTSASVQESILESNKKHTDGQKRYYGRFARGRVQTLRSTDDLDCIFGNRKKSSDAETPNKSLDASSNDGIDDDTEEKRHGLTTITSTSSIQDYFAQKMSEMKARKEAAKTGGQDILEECRKNKGKGTSSGEDANGKKGHAIYGAIGFLYTDSNNDSHGKSGDADDVCHNKNKQVSREWYRDWVTGNGINDDISHGDQEKKFKKKKRKRSTDLDSTGDSNNKRNRGENSCVRSEAGDCSLMSPCGLLPVEGEQDEILLTPKKSRKEKKKKKGQGLSDEEPGQTIVIQTEATGSNSVERDKKMTKEKKRRKKEVEENVATKCEVSEAGESRSSKNKTKSRKIGQENCDTENLGNQRKSTQPIGGDNCDTGIQGNLPSEKEYHEEERKHKKKKRKNKKNTQQEEEPLVFEKEKKKKKGKIEVSELTFDDGMSGSISEKREGVKKKKLEIPKSSVKDNAKSSTGTSGFPNDDTDQVSLGNRKNKKGLSELDQHDAKCGNDQDSTDNVNSKQEKLALKKHERKLRKKERQRARMEKKAKNPEASKCFPGSNLIKIKGYSEMIKMHIGQLDSH